MVVTINSFSKEPMPSKSMPVSYGPQSTDQFMSWTTANNIFPAAQQPARPAYSSYALMYIDQSGNVRTETSQSLARVERHLFPDDIKAYFAECSRGRIPSPPTELSRKRSRLNSLIPKIEECSWTFDGLGMEPTAQVPLRIGDTEKVRAFYEAQWRNFQQTNCRHMGKAYIKIIEPRKQVKFPYNGGKGAPGEKGDPEKTKPEWWPAGVIHREPDHLKKPDRIKLLTHILCNLRHRGIDVAKLQDAGLDAIRQIKPRDRLNILEEIYRVRHLEEQYEDGCIDGSTVIMVSSLETSRTERTDTTTDSCGRYADAAAVAKMEQDDEPASKYLRMSVPHNEGPVWPADCSPARHPSQAGLSSPRSRPSFHMDFDSQVSSLPDDDSETAPPLDYAPVPLSATMEAHDMQASVPRYNSWSSGSMQLQTTYFTTPDYSQPVNPMISQGLMIPGSYITDLAAPPCQTHS